MKVYETFMGLNSKGRRSFCIKLSDTNNGVNIRYRDMLLQAKHFSNVCVFGAEPLLQWEEVHKFANGLLKNGTSNIEITTNGTLTPLGKIDERIHWLIAFRPREKHNKVAIEKLLNMPNKTIMFEILTAEDVDNIEMFVRKFNINKEDCFLFTIGVDIVTHKRCYMISKRFGYNYHIDLNGLLYE